MQNTLTPNLLNRYRERQRDLQNSAKIEIALLTPNS